MTFATFYTKKLFEWIFSHFSPCRFSNGHFDNNQPMLVKILSSFVYQLFTTQQHSAVAAQQKSSEESH